MSIRNIVLFILSKYLIFAAILATMDERFKSLVTNVSNSTADWILHTFHYFMYVLLVTLLFVVLFFGPYWLIFQIKNKFAFALAAAAILTLDSFCYARLNANGSLRYGALDFSVGVVVMVLFFFCAIRQKFLIQA